MKFVPSKCISDGRKYYQFTAIDECTRWRLREIYDEHSALGAKDFLMKLLVAAPFPFRLIQTDNGTEWTNALIAVKATHKTLFEAALEDIGVEYQRIRIATPRHNGKVERQHRTDGERFYKRLRASSLKERRTLVAAYNEKSNATIKTCLNLRTPNQVLADYLALV